MENREQANVTEHADNNDINKLTHLPTFDTESAAQFLGLGKSTLEQYRSHGGGPRFYKIGARKVRYSKEDLLDWLQQRHASSTADLITKVLDNHDKRKIRKPRAKQGGR